MSTEHGFTQFTIGSFPICAKNQGLNMVLQLGNLLERVKRIFKKNLVSW